MSAEGLIDTGAILSILNRQDQWHRSCLKAAHQLRLPLLTSEAVLTEVFHLAARQRIRDEAVWDFIRSGTLAISPIRHDELPAIHTLMEQYRDQPMDFADATLVHLARRERRSAILTIDRDFAAYRIEGRKRFRIYPAN